MNTATIIIGLAIAGLTAIAGIQLPHVLSSEQTPSAQNEKISDYEQSAHAEPTNDTEKNESSSNNSTNTRTRPAEETGATITVKPGDTLDKIAKRKAVSTERLFNANPSIDHPDLIKVGESIYIPAEHEDFAERAIEDISVPQPDDSTANEPQASPQREPTSQAPPAQSSTPSESPSAPSSSSTVWNQLAECESNGNWSINTGNGYYGGLQFSLSSWQAVGGEGYPHQASKSEQILRGERLQQMQGWGAWPACASKLGLL